MAITEYCPGGRTPILVTSCPVPTTTAQRKGETQQMVLMPWVISSSELMKSGFLKWCCSRLALTPCFSTTRSGWKNGPLCSSSLLPLWRWRVSLLLVDYSSLLAFCSAPAPPFFDGLVTKRRIIWIMPMRNLWTGCANRMCTLCGQAWATIGVHAFFSRLTLDCITCLKQWPLSSLLLFPSSDLWWMNLLFR